ncbi:MAG: GTPase HflX, partial [Oscillospiraceae bacterium]|nr:GTPase HflX [Oscillospiraceae bacterium]
MAEVNGNVGGVRKETLDELAGLYDLECDADELVPRRLAETIARVSSQLDKEISVCIDRKGAVRDVSVGNAATAAVAGINTRRGEARLSGVRCVHTHPGGTSEVSDPDLSTLFQLRLDCMVALGLSDGRVRSATVAMMPEGWNEGGQREAPPGGGGEGANDNGGAASAYGHADVYGPYALRSVPSKLIFELIAERDGYGADAGGGVTGHGRERAICVGVQIARQDDYEAEQGMLELRELAKAAGLNVVHSAHQKRGSRDSAFLIGKGFAESLAMLRQEHDATLVVVDDELSGSQVRNLEEMIGTRVIDRSSLVLDIFAMRARSREGKAQVELAQHKYRLPRLIGLGGQLSRQAGSSRVMGGVGTRGPGEKKLETDRRHIRRRVEALERELEELSKRRETGREARRRGGRDMVAIVGYTNAGKSTLLNGLCGSDVFVMDQL